MLFLLLLFAVVVDVVGTVLSNAEIKRCAANLFGPFSLC